jgi:hypothetical protein
MLARWHVHLVAVVEIVIAMVVQRHGHLIVQLHHVLGALAIDVALEELQRIRAGGPGEEQADLLPSVPADGRVGQRLVERAVVVVVRNHGDGLWADAMATMALVRWFAVAHHPPDCKARCDERERGQTDGESVHPEDTISAVQPITSDADI